MKALVLSLLVLTSASPAVACLGGHIKSLKIGNAVIAEIDMSASRVRITDNDSELLSLAWVKPQPQSQSPGDVILAPALNTLPICGFTGTQSCDYDQGLPNRLRLTEQPTGKLLVRVLVKGKERSFTATGFYRTRGSCGGEIQADKRL